MAVAVGIAAAAAAAAAVTVVVAVVAVAVVGCESSSGVPFTPPSEVAAVPVPVVEFSLCNIC